MGLIEDVGQRIAEIRRANGWTQEECAVRLRLTVRRLRRFETGTNLTVQTLERIALGLGVPVAALFEPPPSGAPRRRGRPPKSIESPNVLPNPIARERRALGHKDRPR